MGAGDKGTWFGGDNKFELGYVEFKVSEEDKGMLLRRPVDHPASGGRMKKNSQQRGLKGQASGVVRRRSMPVYHHRR